MQDPLNYESVPIKTGLTKTDVINLLDFTLFYTLLGKRIPASWNAILSDLEHEDIIRHQAPDLWLITALGAALFARHLKDFPRLADCGVRIAEYADNSRVTILRQRTFETGYARALSEIVDCIEDLLPSAEKISHLGVRSTELAAPPNLIRASVLRMLTDQELTDTHGHRLIEIFSDRIELTYPSGADSLAGGFVPTEDIWNKKIADLMHRLFPDSPTQSQCESECEKMGISKPTVEVFDSVRITVFLRSCC